jgi:hypothetical protein
MYRLVWDFTSWRLWRGGGGGGGSNAAGNNQQNTLNQLRLQLANALANDPDCLSFLQGKSGGAPNVLDSIPIDIQKLALPAYRLLQR